MNETLKDILLHYINLEYYANGIDEEFQTLLKELEENCTKAIYDQTSVNTKNSYNVIMKIIKEEVEKFRNELEERLEEVAEQVMEEELEFIDETYNKKSENKSEKKTEKTKDAVKLSLAGVTLSKILFAPIDDKDTTKEFVDRTQKNIITSYENSLRSGYLFGKSSEDIVNNAAAKMKNIERGMQNGIRTAIPSYAKNTDRIVFLRNDTEVVWCSTLDGKTCINCASLSGLHFKSIADAPGIQHDLCRCIFIPASSITEPIPEFKEFVESLDEEDQKTVLGVNRFKLWKEYDVSLNKFLNNGEVIPSKELDKKFFKLK